MRHGLLLLAMLGTSILVAAQVPSPPPQIASALSRMERHSATTVTFAMSPPSCSATICASMVRVLCPIAAAPL